MRNSTPCKIVTPENIILKLCIRDYVGEMTHHANFGFNRLEASPQIGEIFLWLRLSCPYLFSVMRPGRTAGPIFTLYGSNDVFPCKEVPFRTMVDHIWRKYATKTPHKWAEIGNFKAKPRNIKIAMSQKLYKSDQDQIWGSSWDQQLHFVGGLILPRSNPIWLPAAILKNDMTS